MRLSPRMLRRMIMQEMRNFDRRRLQEGTAERPIQITAEYLNRIIREEYEAHQDRQRLAEARSRRRRRARRSYYYW